MLLGTLKDLSNKYQIVIVTLGDIYSHEVNPAQLDDYIYYNLKVKNVFGFIRGIFRLRNILKKHHVKLVHAHLFQSTILARIATSKDLPFLFSVHSHLSRFVSFPQKLIEKITRRKKDVLIAVSQTCRQDYLEHFGNVRKSYVLLNYINNCFFTDTDRKFRPIQPLKIVAVGNVKPEKNYALLLQAIKKMQAGKITLDIYGRTEDPVFSGLDSEVKKYDLPVEFMGMTAEVDKLYRQYDLFVSSSAHEGFGLTVIEAMASGLPLLLSDIAVFREITCNNALFFDPQEPDSFVKLIHEILDQKHDLNELSCKGKKIAENYTREKYLNKLHKIYDENLFADRRNIYSV